MEPFTWTTFFMIGIAKAIGNYCVQRDRRLSAEYMERLRNSEKNANSNKKNAKIEDKWWQDIENWR